MPVVEERAAVRRLFERFGFGPRPGELDAAVAQGFDRTAEVLLAAGDDPGARATPPPALAPEPKPGKDKEARRQAAEQVRKEQAAVTLWWLDRMVASDAPLTERLTWFWHGHFATSAQKVRSARLMLAQNETFRRAGAGDFAVLAKAMAVDPAMLIWLDGQKNTAKAANENLARELMELFTLGVGHYSEHDVREAARALTGWKVNRDAANASMVAKQHDAGAKTVLGQTGDLDAAKLVDVLVAQQASPRFIAQRLWSRLVSSAPPGDDVVDRLVAGYGPGRDVRGMLRALAADPGFRDGKSTLVKQPVEWAVGLMRALRIRPSALPEGDRTKLLAGLRGMGQVPFLPPSVGGWPSGAAWLTTSAALSRLQVARLLTARADLGGLSTSDPVAAIGALLGVDGWSERTRSALGKLTRQPAQLAAVAATAPEYTVSG
jgi:uncharacterized protein (DUF1800 family)